MEQNRFGLLLTYYKLPTVLLLIGINGVIDVGMLGFAMMQGWGVEKVRVWLYWLSLKNWKSWLEKRKRIQSLRTVKDTVLLQQAVSEIQFSEAGMDNSLLKYIANPVMKLYFIFIKMLVWW